MAKKQQTNKLYSYSDMAALIVSMATKPGWLMVKQGLTLKQEIEDRLKQQDTSSSIATIILISTLVIENNKDVKLDNKVSDIQHNTPEFMPYERYDNARKKHEWSWVKISDLVDDFEKIHNTFKELQTLNVINEHALEQFLANHFFNNPDFIEKLDNRIFQSKKQATSTLLGYDRSYKEIRMNPWQQDLIKLLLKSPLIYFLLSLAPRFGKTLMILEYIKQYVLKTKKKIIIIPLSKFLSSNSSFIDEYYECGYDIHGGFLSIKEHTEGSLHQTTETLLLELEKIIPDGYEVILVTDEADYGSHTLNSTTTINAIVNKFKVVKQIAMTGTGIFTASKIFKGIPSDEILFKSINYTELLGYDITNVVNRNFINIQYDMQEILNIVKANLDMTKSANIKQLEVFNINQAFNQPSAYSSLSTFVRKFIDDDAIIDTLELQEDNKVTMVFIPSKTKKNFLKFIEKFQKHNPDIETLKIYGDETSNANAQLMTKNKIKNMSTLNDDRQLVIFSMGMASRSYSVPEIRRVLIFADTYINNPFYQKTARCLTYNYRLQHIDPVQTADIIRISFEKCNLVAELFLVENQTANNDEDTEARLTRTLSRSSFCDVQMNGDDIDYLPIKPTYKTVMGIIDAILKYTDSTKYLMVKLFDIEIEVDNGLSSSAEPKKSKTSSVNLTVPNPNKDKPDVNITDGNIITAAEEKALELYIEVIRTFPYLALIKGITSLEEFIDTSWDDFIIISKSQFINNLNDDIFKQEMNTLFRNAKIDDTILTSTRIEDYLKLSALK